MSEFDFDAIAAAVKKKASEAPAPRVITAKKAPLRLVPVQARYGRDKPKISLLRKIPLPPKAKLVKGPTGKKRFVKPRDLNAFLARTAVEAQSTLQAAKSAVPLYLREQIELNLGKRAVFAGALEALRPKKKTVRGTYPVWVKYHPENFVKFSFEIFFQLDARGWPKLDTLRFFAIPNRKWFDISQIRFDLKEFDREFYDHMLMVLGACIQGRKSALYTLPPESTWYMAVRLRQRTTKDMTSSHFTTALMGVRFKLKDQRTWDWIIADDKRDARGWSGFRNAKNYEEYKRCPRVIVAIGTHLSEAIQYMRYPLPRLIVHLNKDTRKRTINHDFDY